MANCTNPQAVNFNPAATVDDGSCVYLAKVDGACYAFQDVAPAAVVDESFTISWQIDVNNWVFFHDYTPDFYFSTNNPLRLHTVKNNRIYQHNRGPYGQYYDGVKKPFFVDMVFTAESEMTLNSIQWLTEVLAPNDQEFKTFTHISIWNNFQHSGRIAVEQLFRDLQYKTSRRTQAGWSFNDFKDVVKERGTGFLQSLFQDYAPVPGALDPGIPWYEQRLLEGDYFLIRFEFDNLANEKLYVHETDIDVTKSSR